MRDEMATAVWCILEMDEEGVSVWSERSMCDWACHRGAMGRLRARVRLRDDSSDANGSSCEGIAWVKSPQGGLGSKVYLHVQVSTSDSIGI